MNFELKNGFLGKKFMRSLFELNNQIRIDPYIIN